MGNRFARRPALSTATLAGCALMLGLAAGPDTVRAATILNVTGGPGIDGSSALCPTGNFLGCPSSPDLLLANRTNPVTGSFDYDSNTGQLSFALTLAEDVSFTGGAGSETLAAGSTFSASDIWVQPSGGSVFGSTQASGHSPVYASAVLGIGGSTLTDPSVYISSISCTLGPGQCGVTLGAATAGGLGVGPVGGQPYVGNLTFNVNVAPVPLPATLGMLLSGLLVLVGLRPRLSAIA